VELYYDQTDKNILVLRADGGLNSETADQLLHQLEEMIDSGLKRIIVDCAHLEYISSVGIAKLLRIHQRLAEKGGDVRLACVRGALAQILSVVHMNKVFAIYPDVEQARLALRPEKK
jgi:anti-sigma B factor antagonist